MFSKSLLAIRWNEGLHRSTTLPRQLICTGTCRASSMWTKDKVVRSPFTDIQIPNLTIPEYVWQNLDRWPERTATVCAVSGRGYTYEQAFHLSNTFAANLRRKFKLVDGDTVAVMMPNLPDYPLVVLGVLEAGGVVTTINPVYTAHEVQRQLVMSNAKIVVTTPSAVETIRNAFKIAKLDMPIITVKMNAEDAPAGTALFSELSEDVHVDKSCLKEVRRSLDDISILPYSSGTTGLPKGVELRSRNIIANCQQLNEPNIKAFRDTTDSHQDAVVVVLPLFHIYAATVLMFHKMSQGLKLVTLPKFQPQLFLDTLLKYKINLIFAAPPMVLALSTHPSAKPQHFQHLDLIMSGAAPLAASDVERVLEKAQKKFDFVQGYGLTETSPVVTLNTRGSTDYATVGYALPSTLLRVVDNDLNPLGPEQVGELLVRGPQVMQGYRNNDEATRDSFAPGEWFRTGDLATINQDGAVTIKDRLKELIKVKGFQVPPAELEAVLRECPGVLDAAVFGVPHAKNGETPKAIVVAERPGQLSADTVRRFVAERVAPYKQIEHVVFVDDIPKTLSGKILRRELKQIYADS